MPARVHILSSGMAHQNARGFLFPILRARRLLADAGVAVRIFRQPEPALTDADALLVDSKAVAAERRAECLVAWADRCPVGYFDLSDSTCVDASLVGLATLYFKSHLPADRAALARPLYGRRLYTDYYHRHEAVSDTDEDLSRPVAVEDVRRLRLGWNAGLANYSLHGPRMAALYDKVRLAPLLAAPRAFRLPSAPRPVGLALRMKTSYPRQTVAHQRVRTAAVLQDFAPAGRISKRLYFRELAQSRVAVSPFGWGEINQRDYESFLAGVLVIKPDMSHLESWPNCFEPQRTYVPYAWDMSDLRERVEFYLRHDQPRQEIASAAQERYRHHVATRAGQEEFCSGLLTRLGDLRGSYRAASSAKPVAA